MTAWLLYDDLFSSGCAFLDENESFALEIRIFTERKASCAAARITFFIIKPDLHTVLLRGVL